MKSLEKSVLINIVLFIIVSRVILSLIGAFSVELIKIFPFPWHASKNPFLDVWAKWDSAYYTDIATTGYKNPQNSKFPNVVFFPLYPFFLKVVNFFINNILISGILTSNLFLFLSTIVLYKLVIFETKNKILANNTLIFLLIFPTSFFFSAVYPESLFLFVALSSLYFLKKKKLILTIIFGILTSLTRSIGFLIILPILYYAIKNKFKLKEILSLFLILSGTASFLLYLFFQFHLTPFDFVKIEEKAWLRRPWYSLENIKEFIGNILKTYQEEEWIKSWKLIYTINFIFLFSSLFLSIYSIKILKDKTYLIYSLTFLFSPVILGHIISIERFVISIFTIYIALASIKNFWLQNLLKFTSAVFLCILFIMFVNWFAVF
jgi:Gpi18-like mannosyltransferase